MKKSLTQTLSKITILLFCMLTWHGKACGKTLNLNFFPDAENRGLSCVDGSPGGYYVSLAEEGSDTWLFFQQGGGWCYDFESCSQQIISGIATGSHLVSSKHWSKTKNVGGLFDTLENANVIYIPYCSRDAHMADTEVEISGYGTVPLHGRRMAFETVTSLLGDRTNQTVIFGGCSAGGRGSMVTIDALRSLLHPSNNLIGLHDSGDYVEIDPLNKKLDPFMDQCLKAYQFYNYPDVNDQCSSAYPDEKWKCLCGQYMLPLVDVPSQVIVHQFDSFQLGNDIGHSPKFWSREDCHYANDEFRPRINNSVHEISKVSGGKHAIFSPACYHHCLVESSVWEDIQIPTGDGTTVTGWSQMRDFLNEYSSNKGLSAVSNCFGVNCETTCPSIETGPNSYCNDGKGH